MRESGGRDGKAHRVNAYPSFAMRSEQTAQMPGRRPRRDRPRAATGSHRGARAGSRCRAVGAVLSRLYGAAAGAGQVEGGPSGPLVVSWSLSGSRAARRAAGAGHSSRKRASYAGPGDSRVPSGVVKVHVQPSRAAGTTTGPPPKTPLTGRAVPRLVRLPLVRRLGGLGASGIDAWSAEDDRVGD